MDIRALQHTTMEYINFLKLTRPNGIEKYQFKIGAMSVEENEGEISFFLNVQTNKCLRSLSDTKDSKILPSYKINIPIKDFSELKKGAKFQLKNNLNKNAGESLSNLHYWEQQKVENNKIEVIDFQKDKYLIKITGLTQDMGLYKNLVRYAELEILGYFKKFSAET